MGRWTGQTPDSRLFDRITFDEDTGCWLWNGPVGTHGYAEIYANGKEYLAHRFMYEQNIGPIPKGHHVHHTCETRRCVNPLHLRLLTPREHMLASPQNQAHQLMLQTHCKRGHEFTQQNTYISKRGHRKCRACAATAQYIRVHGIDDRQPKVQQ